MSKVKEYFENLVKNGIILQEPANYDVMSLKIYIDYLETENAALRERLKDYEQIESRKNRISKHRREDSQLVADKIARCNKCEYKGTSVEIDGIRKIEICKCPPYKGKWIEEIEQCPKEENLTEERKDDGKGN